MTDRTWNVLFLCTGNTARSILAEGILSHLGRGRFRAFSAGSHPKGVVNPLALEELRRAGLPAEGFRSKSWDEFAAPGAPAMDFVFTVCDAAASEPCPVWIGQPATAHWGIPDPAAVEGTDEERRRAFREAATALRRRIELFLALPLEKLDRLAVQREIAAIGRG
ncbi:MAG TPA: arsenate reductase ArsC [Anaeromyxobacteraceae bacterium]|nr:arsenate reductase ArsC [Anaeromyxobacteraceae bacterium]